MKAMVNIEYTSQEDKEKGNYAVAHTPDRRTVRATACTVMMTRPFKNYFYTKSE